METTNASAFSDAEALAVSWVLQNDFSVDISVGCGGGHDIDTVRQVEPSAERVAVGCAAQHDSSRH